jgi:hypothetical protein
MERDRGDKPITTLDTSQSYGEPGGIRTHDPKIKSLVLYQLSYRLSVCGGVERHGRAEVKPPQAF